MSGAAGKTFNCPVHGHFDLPYECVQIIDTPEFQRLRELKQLGLTYYVYPGASHARFEHSLGVAHLAGAWGKHLLRAFRPEGVLHREDRHSIRALELAGLCHDLGHGPFSHVFENELLPRILGEGAASQWHHEDMSERILDHLVDANHLDLGEHFGDAKELGLVKDLMRGAMAGDDGGEEGSPPGGGGMFGSQGPAPRGGGHGSSSLLPSDPEKRWLFDVVANKTNGIDCDKFDYLARDSRATGVAISLDFRRIMHYSRIAPCSGRVVFKWSEYENLYRGIFQERATMHSKVYTHRKAKGIEFLVCDALYEARDLLGLGPAAGDVDAFLKLDDRLLALVEAMRPDATDSPAAARRAQELLLRLRRRELYVFCDECNVPPAVQAQGFRKPSAADIVSHHTSDGLTVLRPSDVIVSETRINFTAASANPLNRVLFYSPYGDQGDAPFGLQQDQVSSLFGHNHQDHKLRIYCRNRDPRVCEALRTAFRRWSERQAGWGRAQHSTPFKYRSGAGAGQQQQQVGGQQQQQQQQTGGTGSANGDSFEVRASKRARSLFGEPKAAGSGSGIGGVANGGGVVAAARGGGSRPESRLSHSPIPE